MSIISLTPEQYELLIKQGMGNLVSPMGVEDMYEIIPLHAQDGYDNDMDMYCYKKQKRERAMSAALHVPASCLQELIDNAESIRKWVEGDI